MKQEASFGIVPCRKTDAGWEVFLVQLHAGHWGFPKGHANEGEDPLEAARRELLEETGLTVSKLLHSHSFEETYIFKNTLKKVTYFLAQVEGELEIQKAEVAASGWFLKDQVENRLTFPELKVLWVEIKRILSA